jgi:hypothetical protein
MSNTSITSGSQKKHLILKGIGIERPPMAEDDGLAGAPVLVINVDVCRILLTYGNVRH